MGDTNEDSNRLTVKDLKGDEEIGSSNEIQLEGT